MKPLLNNLGVRLATSAELKSIVRAASRKMTSMLSSVLAATGLISSPCSAFAGAVPCETMLQELRSVQSSTSLDDAKRIAILELIMKGLERCTADDDRRADQFFSEALKLMQK
jgi:type IV secretory pathway VirB2 component (pilin)